MSLDSKNQLDQFRRFQKQALETVQPLVEIQKQMSLAVSPIIKQWTELLRQFSPDICRLAKAFEEFPQRQRAALLKMAQHGWYLDGQMPLTDSERIASALEADPIAEERRLCDYYDARITSLIKEIQANFPRRAKLIEAALRAHQKGEYFLSTPVLLIQADGLCRDLVGGNLYGRENGKQKLKNTFQDMPAGSFLEAFIAPVLEPSPLTASAKECIKLKPKLNRHAVLHGESVDYGEREISARAISLLSYVSWSLKRKAPEAAS